MEAGLELHSSDRLRSFFSFPCSHFISLAVLIWLYALIPSFPTLQKIQPEVGTCHGRKKTKKTKWLDSSFLTILKAAEIRVL